MKWMQKLQQTIVAEAAARDVAITVALDARGDYELTSKKGPDTFVYVVCARVLDEAKACGWLDNLLGNTLAVIEFELGYAALKRDPPPSGAAAPKLLVRAAAYEAGY